MGQNLKTSSLLANCSTFVASVLVYCIMALIQVPSCFCALQQGNVFCVVGAAVCHLLPQTEL